MNVLTEDLTDQFLACITNCTGFKAKYILKEYKTYIPMPQLVRQTPKLMLPNN